MWNHRVWRKVMLDEEVFAIHETYYNSRDEICACTENEITAHGYTLDELKENLERMLRATVQPVLELEGFTFAKWGNDGI